MAISKIIVGRVMATAGILILGGMFIAYLLIPKPAKPVAQPASGLNQPSVKFVGYLLINDLEAAQANEESVSGKTPDMDLMGWIHIDRKATAKEYETAYDANEIAADNGFKGKTILLSGVIDGINKDFTDAGYITLRDSGLLGARAQLDQDAMGEAASFKRGQNVNFVCKGTGLVMTVATLDGCEPFNDYLNRLTPSVESGVTDFLEGKIVLHPAMAKLISKMYVAGLSMPADSPCMSGKRDGCEAEFTALFKDKAKVRSLTDQAKQRMVSLKVMPQ